MRNSRGSPVDFRREPVLCFGFARGKPIRGYHPNWMQTAESGGGVELPLRFFSESWLGADPEEKNLSAWTWAYRTVRYQVWKLAIAFRCLVSWLLGRRKLFVFTLHKGEATAHSITIIRRYLSLVSLCSSLGIPVRLLVVGLAETDKQVLALLEQKRLSLIVITYAELKKLLANRGDLSFHSSQPVQKPNAAQDSARGFRRVTTAFKGFLF